MAWYSTGTARPTVGSVDVIGVGTNWTDDNVKPGDTIHFADGRAFEIAARVGVTELQIAIPYDGDNAVAGSYGIAPTNVADRLVALIGQQAAIQAQFEGFASHGPRDDNPHGVTVAQAGGQPTNNPTFTGKLTSETLRLNGTVDASLESTGHPFQIGPDSDFNLLLDANEILARRNGSASILVLNNDGGDVRLGSIDSRIEAAGKRFYVQKGAAASAGTGVAVNDGKLYATLPSDATFNSSVIVPRRETDGKIIGMLRGESLVGVIGVQLLDNLFITGDGSHTGIGFGSSTVYPCANDGDLRDSHTSLGTGNARFVDVYATNGAIQTSDRNEKQDIRGMNEAEISAAKELAGKGVVYRWIDMVEKKGGGARVHSGHIAQDVKSTLEAHGLDPAVYAFFIYSEWWCALVEVPAKIDDDGAEASPAECRLRVFETRAEAEAATCDASSVALKSRMGLRYAELHAFIMAGQAQVMGDVMARLDALEAAQVSPENGQF